MENITHMGDTLEAYLFRLLERVALRLNVEKPEREQVRQNMKEAFFAILRIPHSYSPELSYCSDHDKIINDNTKK